MKDTSIKDLREKLKSEMAAEELALKSEIKAIASKFESRTGLTVEGIVSICETLGESGRFRIVKSLDINTLD